MADVTIAQLSQATSISLTDVVPISNGSTTLKATIAQISVPTGTILDFAGNTPPSEFLECNGQAVSRTTYSTLFAVIGTTWGVGDGSTTFNLPNLQRRVLVGSGGTGTATLANTLGSVGGAETHTLTINEIPSHNHNMVGGYNGYPLQSYSSTWPVAGTYQSGNYWNQGGGASHNNIQPSAVVKKIIKI